MDGHGITKKYTSRSIFLIFFEHTCAPGPYFIFIFCQPVRGNILCGNKKQFGSAGVIAHGEKRHIISAYREPPEDAFLEMI